MNRPILMEGFFQALLIGLLFGVDHWQFWVWVVGSSLITGFWSQYYQRGSKAKP